MSIRIKPIGTIYSIFDDPKNMARQARVDGRPGRLVVDDEYLEGLSGLSDFSHIIALYHFHMESEVRLKVHPCFDRAKLHGIFTCRVPPRPNHIGISVLNVERIDGNTIYCPDVDVLSGTPLLDIKPYVRQFDQVLYARSGWYDEIDWRGVQSNVVPARTTQPADGFVS